MGYRDPHWISLAMLIFWMTLTVFDVHFRAEGSSPCYEVTQA